MAKRVSETSLKVTLDRPHLTRTNTIDRRYKLTGTITNKNLRDIIQNEVNNALKETGPTPNQKSDNVTPKDATISAKKKAAAWRTSIMGVSILGRSLFSTGNHIMQDIASTDKVALEKTLYNSMTSATIMAIGSFGGPWGAVAATLLSTANFVFGNAIKNNIQRKGDKNRVINSFNHYDAYKYGTYCYDNGSGEWVAEDGINAQKRILGTKLSV